jgi:Putative zinc-finger
MREQPPDQASPAECVEIAETFSAFVDGEVNLTERERVTRHIRACATCATRLKRERQTRQLLSRALSVDSWTPPDMRMRVMLAARHQQRGPASRRLPAALAGLVATLLVTLGLLVSIVVGSQGGSVASPPVDTSATSSSCFHCAPGSIAWRRSLPRYVVASLVADMQLASQYPVSEKYLRSILSGAASSAAYGTHFTLKGGGTGKGTTTMSGAGTLIIVAD